MRNQKSTPNTSQQVCDYEYFGAGIPAIISEVTLEPFGNDLIPLLDFEAVDRYLAKEVVLKKSRLNGNEVRFLRQWLDLSMSELAAHFGYTAPAVHKWQLRGDKSAGMHWSAECQLRLMVLDKLGVRATAFRDAFRGMARPFAAGSLTPIRVPGSKVAQSTAKAA